MSKLIPSFVRSSFVPALSSVVGDDLQVPVAEGQARYANLDQAASANCLRSVAEALDSVLPWYSSVHRGAGHASIVCTELLEGARGAVARFVGARRDDQVIFTRNTTDALNLLAHALPEGTVVISFASEHHANLLPWRRPGRHVELPVPRSHAELLESLETALVAQLDAPHRLVAITGASNVTGELFPLQAITALARRLGARVAIDGAQLVPHHPVDLAALDADWIAFSGHKLYAPYGAGALVGRADWLNRATPWLAGGGAVRAVGAGSTEWHEGPARHEGGTPNVLGAIALGAACRALDELGMENVVAHEQALLARARAGLPGVLSLFGSASPRVGILAFEVPGVPHRAVAQLLSREHGIGVRDGAFCAHPLIRALLPGASGAVRASFGVGTTSEDVDRLIVAVRDVASRTNLEVRDEVRRPTLHRLISFDARAVPVPCAFAS